MRVKPQNPIGSPRHSAIPTSSSSAPAYIEKVGSHHRTPGRQTELRKRLEITSSMQLTTIDRDGFKISFANEEEFELIYNDVFVATDYEFSCDTDRPLIIDAGAHIGLATLFFKRKYPEARIVALEPNPVTFAILERNIQQNHLEDVQLVQAALATGAGLTPYHISGDTDLPWTWGDSVVRNAWASEDSTREVSVPAVTLSSFLTQRIDLLKLDVEGLEVAVLSEAAPRLKVVDQLIAEFHGSRTNPTNSPDRMLLLLRENGFAYTVTQDGRIIDERRIRVDDPYWLIIRARRLTGGRVKRFLGSQPKLYRLHSQMSQKMRVVLGG